MPKLLLHICCANCGTIPIELLKDEFDLTLFWFNPNIHPLEEYQERLADVRKLSQIYNLRLIEGPYSDKEWFSLVKGLESEPEGGKRCDICFEMRLLKTAQQAKKDGFPWIATTLTIGPQKRAETINRIGQKIANQYQLNFYQADFKKKDGFKKSVILSKKYNFHRQNYCGCVYSQTR